MSVVFYGGIVSKVLPCCVSMLWLNQSIKSYTANHDCGLFALQITDIGNEMIV